MTNRRLCAPDRPDSATIRKQQTTSQIYICPSCYISTYTTKNNNIHLLKYKKIFCKSKIFLKRNPFLPDPLYVNLTKKDHLYQKNSFNSSLNSYFTSASSLLASMIFFFKDSLNSTILVFNA